MATTLKLFALSRRLAHSSRPSPTLHFDFIDANKADKKAIVDLCLSDFIHVEPHCKAMKFTLNEIFPIFDWIVGKSLDYPFCYKVIDKSSQSLIGFRLMSLGYRDTTKEVELDIDESQCSQNLLKFAYILDSSKSRFWKVVDPDVQKVLRREITFVLPQHQRKGIAQHLVHLGIDFDKLRASGVDGIVSEASSFANQTLLSKHGYKCLVEPNYKIEMHDGNPGVKVFFKDLRKL